MQPGNLPFRADRWTPFVRTLDFVGFDLTGAVFLAEIRTLPDAPGAPLISLGTVTTASAEGVRLISTATVGATVTSTMGIRINETTMESMPAAPETGDDVILYWDIHITPPGGIKERWLYGTFTVKAGVTQ